MRVKRHFWLEASETWEISDGADRTSNKFGQGMDWRGAGLPQPCGFSSEGRVLTLFPRRLPEATARQRHAAFAREVEKLLGILIRLGKTRGGRGGGVGFLEELFAVTLT